MMFRGDERRALRATLVLSLVLGACSSSDPTSELAPDETTPDGGSADDDDDDRDSGSMDAGADHATTLAVLSPRAGTAESRRLLRATITDDDGIATVRYALNGGAATDVPISGAPTTFDVRAVLDVVPGENQLRVEVEDADGHRTSETIAFRFGAPVAGGGSHSGVLAGGKLYTFGRNNVGQLGIDPTAATSKSEPTVITTAAQGVALAFNQNQSALLEADGSGWVWGENTSGNLGLGDSGAATRRSTPTKNTVVGKVASLESGYNHMLALLSDGTVKAWGSNSAGQVGVAGNGQINDIQSSPVIVAGLPKDVVKIEAGSNASFALTATGDVWAWGDNADGALGIGSVDGTRHPTPVKVPGVSDVIDIAVGRDHVLALATNGTVASWGLGASGQLGAGDPPTGGSFAPRRPTAAPVTKSADGKTALDGIAAVYANGTISFALGRDGKLWGWGEDGNGSLALGGAGGSGRLEHQVGYAVHAAVYAQSSGKTEYLDERAKLVALSFGALHGVTMTDKGAVYTWGWSTNGTLGIADFPAIWRQPTPVLVPIP